MSKSRFTAAKREQIAKEFRASGQGQAVFAARVGVCPRTLRNWLRRHSPSAPTGSSARHTVMQAVAALRQAASTLEAGLLVVTPKSPEAAANATDAIPVAAMTPSALPSATPETPAVVNSTATATLRHRFTFD